MMIDDILKDGFSIVKAENRPILSKDYNYEQIHMGRKNAQIDWNSMGKEERGRYPGGIGEYLKKLDLNQIEETNLDSSKNYYLYRMEIEARLRASNLYEILQVDSLNHEESVFELLENTENTQQIRELYRQRKLTAGKSSKSGIAEKEAVRLRNCLRQGRELYVSGRQGSLMVKPLNFFYSLTAYAYGIIILNNPMRWNLDTLPGAHGMNFLPKTYECQFGGDQPRGTFSELFGSYPTSTTKDRGVEITQDCLDSQYEFHRTKITTSCGTLLSMVPELSDYYKMVTKKNGRTHPLARIMHQGWRACVQTADLM